MSDLISKQDAIETIGFDLWMETNGVFDSIEDAYAFVKNSLKDSSCIELPNSNYAHCPHCGIKMEKD